MTIYEKKWVGGLVTGMVIGSMITFVIMGNIMADTILKLIE